MPSDVPSDTPSDSSNYFCLDFNSIRHTIGHKWRLQFLRPKP